MEGFNGNIPTFKTKRGAKPKQTKAFKLGLEKLKKQLAER